MNENVLRGTERERRIDRERGREYKRLRQTYR